MPITPQQLKATSPENVRVVPIEPKVKSAETCELSLRGVSAKAGSAKSADPTCYDVPVGVADTTRNGLFDNVENAMTSTAKRVLATPRRDKWHEIEGRLFGQCLWQEVSKSRRCLLEGLMHKASGQIMIVEKTFNDPIPRNGERTYPELGGVVVYAQVARELTEWDEFERAIAQVS